MSIINRHTHYSISAQSQANTLVIATSEDKVHIKASELFREIQEAMGRKYVIQFQETATTGTTQDRIQKMVDVVLNGYKEKHSFLTNVVVNTVANWWCKLWGTSSEWSKIRSQANDILTSVSNYAPRRSESSNLEENFLIEMASIRDMTNRFPMRIGGTTYEATAASPVPKESAIQDLFTQLKSDIFFQIATKGDGKVQCWIDSGAIDLLPVLLFSALCGRSDFDTFFGEDKRGALGYFNGILNLCQQSRSLDIVSIIGDGLKDHIDFRDDRHSGLNAFYYVKVIILALAAAKQCKKSEILETDFSLWEKNKRMDTVTKDEILALKREDFKDPIKILKVAILMVGFLQTSIGGGITSGNDISFDFLQDVGLYQLGKLGRSIFSDDFFNRLSSSALRVTTMRQVVSALIIAFYKLAKEV